MLPCRVISELCRARKLSRRGSKGRGGGAFLQEKKQMFGRLRLGSIPANLQSIKQTKSNVKYVKLTWESKGGNEKCRHSDEYSESKSCV